jgi:3',5'-cyclic AMP phosphodiesterase CpdA
MKRVVVIADLHCGHKAGLTHPDWNPPYATYSPHYKLYRWRRESWEFYAETMAELQPIDVLIANGDLTDGKGKKSGGTELLTSDRVEQSDMAIAAIKEAKAGKVFMTYGTPYHGGNSEDFEALVAKGVKAQKIGGHDWLNVNGVVFDYRHCISRSSIPHGRYTAIAREKLWSIMWAEHGEYPKSDILLRSHVHYFAYCGGYGWLGIITPALQGGTKYGKRQVSGTVDFGVIWFDIPEDGKDWSWHYKILKLKDARRRVLKA